MTARYFEDFYVERSTVCSVLVREGVSKTEVSATKISAPHLEVVTYPSDREVAPGNSFSLVVEITPGPGTHVYGPGAKGYQDIPRRALEAVAVEGYRSGASSRGQVGRLLGLNFWETEAFLKEKKAYLPNADSELAQDRASLDSVLGA